MLTKVLQKRRHELEDKLCNKKRKKKNNHPTNGTIKSKYINQKNPTGFEPERNQKKNHTVERITLP